MFQSNRLSKCCHVQKVKLVWYAYITKNTNRFKQWRLTAQKKDTSALLTFEEGKKKKLNASFVSKNYVSMYVNVVIFTYQATTITENDLKGQWAS